MLKKVLTFGIALLMMGGICAQEAGNNVHYKGARNGAKSITFAASDVQYWVGTGSNSAVVIIGWDDNTNGNFALAWGVHWNGSATAVNMLDSIATHDSRVQYAISSGFVTNIGYNDGTLVSGSTASYWCYTLNGGNAGAYGTQAMANGDVMEISSSCMFSLTTASAATNPNGTPTLPDTVDAAIDPADILYWVGSGSNEAIFIVNWANPDTALAWGYRFNGTVTAQQMIDSIDAADPRFWTVGTPSLSGDVHFITSNGDTLGLSAVDPNVGYNFWWTNLNGVSAGSGTAETLHDGDVFKYGDLNSATGWDMQWGFYMEEAWNTIPTPVPDPFNDPEVPESATIDASDIVYWVGEGSNEAIFVVNWADTALAWGYRFSTDSVALSTVMDDIAAADPRFSYVEAGGFINDINFIVGTDTLGVAPFSWWEHQLNGYSSAGLYSQLHNGDFSRWADPAAGIVIDSFSYDWGGTTYWSYIYAYPQTITPVGTPVIIPQSATIDASDIVYWVGEGSNEAIFVVNWADTALAWGYRFSTDSVALSTVMDDIAAADPRFSYVETGGFINDINFIVGTDTLGVAPFSWWEHQLNGYSSAGLYSQLHDGDFSRWADPAAGIVIDSFSYDWGGTTYWSYIYAYPQTITPVNEPDYIPQSATIDASAIRYWVGEGSNEAIFVVNWAHNAFAWGYRFSTDSVALSTVMDDIAAADPRFSYVEAGGFINDINFIVGTDTLGVAPFSWWEHLLNGYSSAGLYSQLHDGDFSRWADPAAGIVIDSFSYDWGGTTYWSYIYAYPQTIVPVDDPNEPTVGPFCGAVGTEGCTAIAWNDNRIKGWATGCTIVRGTENLSNPDAPAVTYGEEADAIGPASTSTMDVVSLGDGGSATLTFAHPIRNGEGYDFAVFENSFNDAFLELAFVEVSSDGSHFVRFPATSLTQTHTQIASNVDPTFINNLAGKYRVGYGTPFDLEELRDSANLDINNITHVRVVDVVGSIDPQYGTYDAYGHIINDPFPTISYSGGFDLDGICVLNQGGEGIDGVETASLQVYPNPANSHVTVRCQPQGQASEAVLYDMSGRAVYSTPLAAETSQLQIATAQLPSGVYMLRIGTDVVKVVVRH